MIKYEIDSPAVMVCGERYVFGETVELDEDDTTSTVGRLIAAGHMHAVEEHASWDDTVLGIVQEDEETN